MSDSIKFEGRYSEIPPLTQAGIKRYIENKITPGGFMTAVLSNDLQSAVNRADENNLKSLKLIVDWFGEFYPDLYGREKFIAHLRSIGTGA